jgi:hypothetical protein
MKRHRLNMFSSEERAELNLYIKDALEVGSTRPAQSEFGSPITFVRKADGSLRLYIHYRSLNELTHKHAKPLSRVDETLDELTDADLPRVSQVRVRDEDIHKTAHETLDGLMEWIAMPLNLAIHSVQCTSYVSRDD